MNKNDNFDPDLVKQFLNEYQDRGMLKWQGFYLSDQTAKLREVEKQQYETEHRERSREMSSAAINHVIQKALLKNLTVKIELNEISREHIIPPCIEGKINGFYKNKLVIGQHDQLVDIENIYAISIFK